MCVGCFKTILLHIYMEVFNCGLVLIQLYMDIYTYVWTYLRMGSFDIEVYIYLYIHGSI